ncbi:MAG: hypothetical protein RQ753_06695 [Desulfurivibrionaceae bacterium]|nr:hypothetical protein [Desulfobacterales bacterium]MDT8335367.1 hypothetical protein [Desulfurivibrionaceae bacterium]
MIAHKKEFTGGLLLFIAFWIVFAIGMSPIFGGGDNILNYMDNLYNTISKKSAYYIPTMQEKIKPFEGRQVDLTIKAEDGAQAERTARLFRIDEAQTTVSVEGENVKVSGDLGAILADVIADADAMFNNNGEKISAKYGYDAKQALYDLWNAMSAAEKNLNKQKMFKEAKIVNQVQAKAVEPAYNYYGIQAEDIKSKLGIVIASLAGYVLYTLWFGFSILFMFEGWGLKLEH